jgi:hypothetical protein
MGVRDKIMSSTYEFELPVAKPSKFYVAGVKLRQLIYRNSTSYPYISSDALKELCEIAYPYHEDELTVEFVDRLLSAKKVFCPSHLSEEMLHKYGKLMNAELLIFSNSDHEFHKPMKNLPARVKLVLLENSYISDNSLIYTLPIGIENLRVGMNGMKSFFKRNYKKKKNRLLLVGPFSPTHRLRSGVVKGFYSTPGPWKVINHRMNPRSYARISSKYGYVACVRGNSVESHRLWETLYRGSTPLVYRDTWSESLENLKLPIMLVDSWDPIYIQEYLESRTPENFNPRNIPALWIPYWEKFIKDKLEA